MNSINPIHSSFNSSSAMCMQPPWLSIMNPGCLRIENIWKEIQTLMPEISPLSCYTSECVDFSSDFLSKLSYRNNNNECGLRTHKLGPTAEIVDLTVANGQTSFTIRDDINYFTAITDFKQFMEAEWKLPLDGATGVFSIKQDSSSPETITILLKNKDWEISGDCQLGSNKVLCLFKEFAGFAVHADMSKHEDSNGGTYYHLDITAEPNLLFGFRKNLGHFACHLDANYKITSAAARMENWDGNMTSPAGRMENTDDSSLFNGEFDCTDAHTCSGKAKVKLDSNHEIVTEHRIDDEDALHQHRIFLQRKVLNQPKQMGLPINQSMKKVIILDLDYSRHIQKNGSVQFKAASQLKTHEPAELQFACNLYAELHDHQQFVKYNYSTKMFFMPFSFWSLGQSGKMGILRVKEGKTHKYKIQADISQERSNHSEDWTLFRQVLVYGALVLIAAIAISRFRVPAAGGAPFPAGLD